MARELEQVLTRYCKWRRVLAEFHQASEEDRHVGDFALLEDGEVLVHISIILVNRDDDSEFQQREAGIRSLTNVLLARNKPNKQRARPCQ